MHNWYQLSYNVILTGNTIIPSISEPTNMNLSKLEKKLEDITENIRDFEEEHDIDQLQAQYNRYKSIHRRNILNETQSMEEMDAINKISMLFGILRVDLGRDFTIFEGPIDAMFMNNSIDSYKSFI